MVSEWGITKKKGILQFIYKEFQENKIKMNEN